MYKHLQGGDGIPKLYYYGNDGDKNIMIIEMLGHSIERLFKSCGKKFSMATVLALGEQMVLACIHILPRIDLAS